MPPIASKATSPMDRRTVLKGAAWSVPVIATAVAVPSFAATGDVVETQLDFFLTAGEVIGLGNDGSIRSNGVRISPANPAEPKVIAAGTTFTITVEYTGSNPAVDFTNPPYGQSYWKGQSQAWSTITVTPTKIVYVAQTQFSSAEPVIGSFSWGLPNGVRPEDNSIVFSGVAVLAPGGDFPQGGTHTGLMIDPNAGTGSLSGPTATTWP